MIKYINDLIVNYINDRKMRQWVENCMCYYRNRLNENATLEEAFMYVMQSATSRFTDLSVEEQKQVAKSLWDLLKEKNHSLTRLW